MRSLKCTRISRGSAHIALPLRREDGALFSPLKTPSPGGLSLMADVKKRDQHDVAKLYQKSLTGFSPIPHRRSKVCFDADVPGG